MVHLFTGSIIYDFLEKKSVGGTNITPTTRKKCNCSLHKSQKHLQAVASFKYAIRSARSFGFFSPGKTILVPGMYCTNREYKCLRNLNIYCLNPATSLLSHKHYRNSSKNTQAGYNTIECTHTHTHTHTHI